MELEPSTSCPQSLLVQTSPTLQPTLLPSPSSLPTLSSAGAKGETLSLLRSSPSTWRWRGWGCLGNCRLATSSLADLLHCPPPNPCRMLGELGYERSWLRRQKSQRDLVSILYQREPVCFKRPSLNIPDSLYTSSAVYNPKTSRVSLTTTLSLPELPFQRTDPALASPSS